MQPRTLIATSAVVVAMLWASLSPLAAQAATAPADTSRVAYGPATTLVSQNEYEVWYGYPSISADGRYIAYQSEGASGSSVVFVRDMVAGTTTQVSGDTGQIGGQPLSYSASVSGDGHYIAFVSASVRGYGGHVFVRDMVEGTTTQVDVDNAGNPLNGASRNASVSGDGRYIAFDSTYQDLVPPYDEHVFVRDIVGGTTTQVDVDSAGNPANGGSGDASVSGDGHYIAFVSGASNLVPGDTNSSPDVYVRDMVAGTTSLVTLDNAGNPASGGTDSLSISGSGRYIAFSSAASNLVPGDTNGSTDVFVRDMVEGRITRVNLDNAGNQANGSSYEASVSGDGRYIAFNSRASNLVPGDTNSSPDVYVRDMVAGTTSLVTLDNGGNPASGQTYGLSISDSGRYIAFSSMASTLVAGDTNRDADVFLRDLGSPAPPAPVRYFALGDSYSSGEGVRSYLPGTDTSSNRCHRSGSAYPTRFRLPGHDQALYVESPSRVRFSACSGATTRHVMTTAQNGSQPPQIAALASSSAPDKLVTISIGGNNVGFRDILTWCALKTQCQNARLPGGSTLADQMPGKLDRLANSVRTTFQALRAYSDSVWVLGYPMLFPDTAAEQQCTKLAVYRRSEQNFFRTQQAAMNARMAEVAREVGVHYVDVSGWFANHEICSDPAGGGEWIRGVTLPDGVPSTDNLVGPGSFHPNAEGQRQYALALESAMRNEINAGCPLEPTGLPSNPPAGSSDPTCL